VSDVTVEPSDKSSAAGSGLLQVKRVQKAFEQVYEQLRGMILSGRLAAGQRLPPEAQLATQFGVSRSTIREALRLLVSDGLARTAKGSGGGTFVTIPTLDHVSDFVGRNLELLSLTDDLTLSDFLEMRELIEVFAVRHAAERRSDDDLARLRGTLPRDGEEVSAEAQYPRNRNFHTLLVEACGNSLLRIAAQPIFSVLHTHLGRSTLPDDFTGTVCADHAQIIEPIAAGDPDEAEVRMRKHLHALGDVYEQIWNPALSKV
jgi:DNA-binding FadR family transcriptional regulator